MQYKAGSISNARQRFLVRNKTWGGGGWACSIGGQRSVNESLVVGGWGGGKGAAR
jgi:hypothetical protein